MRYGPILSRSFYDRPCLEVAPDLIGKILVHRLADGKELAGRIVEVEAYLGVGKDPASHAFRGETKRNRAMFGPPGRLYVYRSYGIHLCANVVCEADGRAAAVLLRAVEPLEGTEWMHKNRKFSPPKIQTHLTNGPGKLTQAFGIQMDHDGRSLLRGNLVLRNPSIDSPVSKAKSRRIGISKGVSMPFRFYDPASAYTGKTPKLHPK